MLKGYFKSLKVKKVEAELPFATRYFAQLLSLGVGPEEAVEKMAGMDFGELSVLLKQAVAHFKKGNSLEKAFALTQKSFKSSRYDQFVSIILQTARIGVTAESSDLAMRLARRFIEEKKAEYQEFSAKSSIFSMLSIAITALLPAVLAFIIAFTGNFSELSIYFIFLLVLPAVSLAMFARLKTLQPD